MGFWQISYKGHSLVFWFEKMKGQTFKILLILPYYKYSVRSSGCAASLLYLIRLTGRKEPWEMHSCFCVVVHTFHNAWRETLFSILWTIALPSYTSCRSISPSTAKLAESNYFAFVRSTSIFRETLIIHILPSLYLHSVCQTAYLKLSK